MNDRIEWIKNPLYGSEEATVKGSLELIKPKVFHR